MKFLAIETSTVETVVVIGSELKLFAWSSLRLEKGRGERLPEMIAACLKKAHLELEDMDVFSAGVGPGSFTGLRAGLSLIKGLSYSVQKPIVWFSSLDAIAFNKKPNADELLAVAVDARRSNVYCRFYKAGAALTQPAMMVAADFFKKISRNSFLSGDAIYVYKQELLKKKNGIVFCQSKDWYPTPRSVAACVRDGLAKKNVTDSFHLNAVYFYGSDCQVKK